MSERIARVEEERVGVLAAFPIAAWPALPLDRYALGTDAKEAPFCPVLEYRT